MNPEEVLRHTLRHTAITHLVQAGVDLPTVKRISGHKTLAMVEKYSHQNGEHIQAAMDKLESRLKFA
jgi:site-specific recombinase XerD